MNKKIIISIFVILVLTIVAPMAFGQQLSASPEDVTFKLSLEGSSFSKAVNILLLMTALSLVPAAIMMMTSFTRIVIVLAILKRALMTQTAPSRKIISSLALFLTIFIMQPVWTEIYETAITPYSKKQIDEKTAIGNAVLPLKKFMLSQTRDASLLLFMDLAGMEPVDSPDDLPMTVIVPAFMLSELKTAFQMGFMIYLPFLLVDVVIATTLMSMGMMMMPPMMISMPFKLLFFIIIDGWEMTVRALVSSFT